jgi:two-component system response regulator MtrA
MSDNREAASFASGTRERGARRDWAAPPDAPGTRQIGGLRLDPEQWRAWRNGDDLRLTRTEFALLWALAATPNEPCSRDQLTRQVWGTLDTGNTNLVAVCIRRLRQKLEIDPAQPRYIQTIRRYGYVLCRD